MNDDLTDILESDTNLTAEDMKKLIDAKLLEDPLLILQSISQGNDPRMYNQLALKLAEIEPEELNTMPTIKALIIDLQHEFKYSPVNIKDSINASKILLEYIYPKKKSIDINQKLDANVKVSIEPLSKDEIKEFRNIFESEF